MTFCVVQRDLDRHLSEISRAEQEDEYREEIRYQLNLMMAADNIHDHQTYREVISAGAKAIQEYLGET